MSDTPTISVIATAFFNVRHNKRTLAHLRQQTIASQIELVFVQHENTEGELDSDWLEGFHSVKHITATFRSVGKANWHGIQAATAPIVALTEDHCFMQEDWAEVIVSEYQGGDNIAAVGPVMHNANPRTAISRAEMLTSYGVWMTHQPDLIHLPGHNGSYKREILLKEYTLEQLAIMLEAESKMQWELVEKGYRLVHSADLHMWHVNSSQWSSFVQARTTFGLIFGGLRAQEWSLPKRLIYCLASPLVPFVRLRRLFQSVPAQDILDILFFVMMGYIFATVAEVRGYLNPNVAVEITPDLEWNRYAIVDEVDQEMLKNAPYRVPLVVEN